MTHRFRRHSHSHEDASHSKRALKVSIAVVAAVLVMEAAGAVWTNSLALFSDAAHVLLDLLSFSLSLAAIALSERPVSDKRTFGWHRAEVLAALVNGLLVLVIAFFIFFHALGRISRPPEILTTPMLAIAVAGLVMNLVVIWKLSPHVRTDLNVRGAFLHAMGDAAASVAVVAGGILVWATGNTAFDSMAAVAVALLIMVNAYWVLSESVHILLEGAPKGMERDRIVLAIEEIAGARTVRDFHVWSLCSHIHALSVHLSLPGERMAGQKDLIEKLNADLGERFNIRHTTIQIESDTWQAPGTGAT